jgi:hypothetical protein
LLKLREEWGGIPNFGINYFKIMVNNRVMNLNKMVAAV